MNTTKCVAPILFTIILTVGLTLAGRAQQKVVTYQEYDQWGNLLEATDANGQTIRYQYDASGVYLQRIRRVGSPNLDQTATYNSRGLVESITGPSGVTQTFGYDGLSRLREIKNDAGQTVTEYDYRLGFSGSSYGSGNSNRILTTSHPGGSGSRQTAEYVDGLGRTIQTQVSEGDRRVVTDTDYDGRGRPWKAGKPFRTKEDSDLGYVTEMNGSNEKVLEGLVIYISRAYTAKEEITIKETTVESGADLTLVAGERIVLKPGFHAEAGSDVSATIVGPRNANDYYDNDFAYKETQYEDSPLDRPDKIIPEGGATASGAVTTGYDVRPWTHDGQTHNYQVTTTTDESGKVTETWTDGWGRTVRTVADPGGINAETVFEYDELDNLTKVTAPNGTETTYAYNAKGELTEKTSADAGTVKYKYDAAGNLRFAQDAVRAAAGEVVFYRYDQRGRKITEGVASATFSNLDGDQTYSFESNTSNWKGRWAYDAVPSTSPYPWSQFGLLIEDTDQHVSNTTGQLVARAWKVADGSSSQMGSNPWQMELYSYDREGRVQQKWIWTGDRREWDTHLAYEYNRLGEVTRQKIEVGSEVLYQHYTYNQRGLLDKVYLTDDGTADTEPAEITYTYTASGAVDQITYRNGNSTVTNGYDIRGRLTDINDINSTSGSPFAAQYEYKKNSNVDKAHFWNPNITTGINLSTSHRTFTYDYSYDDLSRLANADYQLDGSNPPAFDVSSITYDAAGNIDLLQRNDQAGSLVDDLDYSYTNGTNQLSSITDNASSPHSWDPADGSFTYDSNGNLTSMTGNPELSDIVYDHRNLPVHMYLPDSTEQINNYNADGQRILKEVKTSSGSTWSFYIQDGLSTLGVIQGGELQYLNILADGVSGRVIANSGAIDAENAKRYYLKDLIGSTRAVVDENGTTTENRDYYPFGLLMDERQYVQGAETTEKFSGKERDEQTGFDYFGARYYMPGLGRWLSVDPLASERPSLTPYNYVQNNPLLLIDPTGLLDDYALNEETGELTLIKKTDDEHDRIVKTDKDGNVKKKGEGLFGLAGVFMSDSKANESRVAVDNIEKGILKDGINFKAEDNVIGVGGEGQASLAGVEDFLTKFSNHIGLEMSGAYLSEEVGANADISNVYIDEYMGNTPTQATTSLNQLYTNPALSNLNTTTHFHTHISNRGFSRGAVTQPSDADKMFKSGQQRYFRNFIILTRSGNYPYSAEKISY